jgi:hypothetical protein
MLFYQSLTSSTCARSAVGNLLSLYRREVKPKELRELFACSGRNENEVSHRDLLLVVRSLFPSNLLTWVKIKHFSIRRLCCSLNGLNANPAPLLLTLRIRHSRNNWTGLHCTVVLGVGNSGVLVLDSLGRRDGSYPNATITHRTCTYGWRMSGAPLIVTAGPMCILKGLPPLY